MVTRVRTLPIASSLSKRNMVLLMLRRQKKRQKTCCAYFHLVQFFFRRFIFYFFFFLSRRIAKLYVRLFVHVCYHEIRRYLYNCLLPALTVRLPGSKRPLSVWPRNEKFRFPVSLIRRCTQEMRSGCIKRRDFGIKIRNLLHMAIAPGDDIV